MFSQPEYRLDERLFPFPACNRSDVLAFFRAQLPGISRRNDVRLKPKAVLQTCQPRNVVGWEIVMLTPACQACTSHRIWMEVYQSRPAVRL